MAKEREYFIHGQVDEQGNVIIPGCVRNGIDEQSANKIFDEMAEFAKYAFNKSHAAAYSVVSYQTAYLKAYYPEELMAATLNSFLGNLDKVPEYIDECKRMKIEILKPDINKSQTKFTVDEGKIRFGLGTIKNVGISAVDIIVKEREERGDYKDFSDFCERIASETVNRKCIESLIKAGCFDTFGQTRSTLLASFESILDTITTKEKNSLKGQVSMFEMVGGESNLDEIKYIYTILPEMSKKDLLSLEREMLGIYISGHPLENYKEAIAEQTNINTLKIHELTEQLQNMEGRTDYKDGDQVKYAGIITKIKKKYTKNNTIMAFVTVEDLYGECEVIVFDSCYSKSSQILMEENIVLVEGRLSIRDEDNITIVAREIKPLNQKETSKVLLLDITNLNEEQKSKLRGALKFFNGERNNIRVQIKQGEEIKNAGAIYCNEKILEAIKEICPIVDAS